MKWSLWSSEWWDAAWIFGWGILWLIGYVLAEIDYDQKRRGRDD